MDEQLDGLCARLGQYLRVRLGLELSDPSVAVVARVLSELLGALVEDDGSSRLLEERKADDQEGTVDDQLDPLDPAPSLRVTDRERSRVRIG